MVKEYEDGLSREIQEDTYTSGGQTVCTLSSTLKPLQTQAKKSMYTGELKGIIQIVGMFIYSKNVGIYYFVQYFYRKGNQSLLQY